MPALLIPGIGPCFFWLSTFWMFTFSFASNIINTPSLFYGGLALFHTVHMNLGPDGPPPLKCGLCGSMLVDFQVDILSPKAAPVGDKQKRCISKSNFQKSKIVSRKLVCGKSCVGKCVPIGQHCYISIKFRTCTFPIGDPPITKQADRYIVGNMHVHNAPHNCLQPSTSKRRQNGSCA